MIPKFPIELKTNSLPEPVIKRADIDVQDLILKKLSSEVYPTIFFQMTHATRTGETHALQRKHIYAKRDEFLRKMWNKARNEAGVEKITLYEDTRHIVASQAVSRGAPISTIQ